MASEIAGHNMAEASAKVAVVGPPRVRDTRKQGLVSPFIEHARRKGASAYVGEGLNRWPASHV